MTLVTTPQLVIRLYTHRDGVALAAVCLAGDDITQLYSITGAHTYDPCIRKHTRVATRTLDEQHTWAKLGYTESTPSTLVKRRLYLYHLDTHLTSEHITTDTAETDHLLALLQSAEQVSRRTAWRQAFGAIVSFTHGRLDINDLVKSLSYVRREHWN